MSVKKKHIIGMAGTVIAAVGLVSVLAWVAVKPTLEKNGFNRQFINPKLSILNFSDKPDDVTELCGSTRNSLFFRTKMPGKIWVTDYDLKNGHYWVSEFPVNKKMASSFTCNVDSPFLSILAGNLPAIVFVNPKGNIKTSNLQNSIFTRAVKISSSSFVFRGFDSSSKRDQIFIKRNLATGEVKKNGQIIEPNHDMGITSDGFLNYDSATSLLVYVFLYKNGFICMDTNLNLIRTNHTIDTIEVQKAITGITNNGLTNISPVKVVNAKSCVHEGTLYNMSKLKADNEAETSYYNSIVDQYDIRDGFYKGSFYIPEFRNERVSSFKVLEDNKIIALYKKFILSYDKYE